MKKILFLLILLNVIISLNGLYFHMYKGEPNCFYDEYYSDTVTNKKIKKFLNF